MRSSVRRLIQLAAPPVALFLLIVAIWEAAVAALQIRRFLLPPPSAVCRAVVENAAALLTATAWTAAAAVCGFLASLIVGTVIAFAFSQSRVIRSSVYPYAIFLQTVPMIAVAPLIVLWFGYGFQSVVVVSFVISLFPILANV